MLLLFLIVLSAYLFLCVRMAEYAWSLVKSDPMFYNRVSRKANWWLKRDPAVVYFFVILLVVTLPLLVFLVGSGDNKKSEENKLILRNILTEISA